MAIPMYKLKPMSFIWGGSNTYSIGDNDIGPAGLSHLCEMLKVNGTLEILRQIQLNASQVVIGSQLYV